jgi:hypothetical protein
MALEEVSVVDKIEVLLDGVIQIRRRDQILKDGVEVAATFVRSYITPGSDLENQDSKVVAIAEAVWTQEVIDAYNQKQQASLEYLSEPVGIAST